MKPLAFGLMLGLAACATTEPAVNSPETYRGTIARALGYFEGTSKRYVISGPLAVPKGLSICVRDEMDDGRGRMIPGGQMLHFLVNHGRIIESFPDNNCIYRDFGSFSPIKK